MAQGLGPPLRVQRRTVIERCLSNCTPELASALAELVRTSDDAGANYRWTYRKIILGKPARMAGVGGEHGGKVTDRTAIDQDRGAESHRLEEIGIAQEAGLAEATYSSAVASQLQTFGSLWNTSVATTCSGSARSLKRIGLSGTGLPLLIRLSLTRFLRHRHVVPASK